MKRKVFKVLVVDDNEPNLKVFRILLQSKGYEVIEALNGDEAVKYARLYHPDLILMDIRMPVMDGITATKIIKEDPVLKNIPVIALTSSAMSGSREQF
ncbi:MAG: Polar-differentiation response regulator DivK [candidate division WS2 bacterium]|nr:Polar-differentiation response regulator DivK [Candidatus Psychracetigena formicireducens]